MPVYFLQAGGPTGPVKIGHGDPNERLGTLQVGNHLELRVIRVFEGGKPEEDSLHDRFVDLWIRGEWHNFSRVMLGDLGMKPIEGYAAPGRRMTLVAPVIPPESKPHHQQLLSEIEVFLSTRRMAETTFGHASVNDGKFVGRLRAGANMTLATIERARTYIREQEAACATAGVAA